MQASGLTEFIPFICTSAIWSQTMFFFFFFFYFSHISSPLNPSLKQSLWGDGSICWTSGIVFPFESPHSHLEVDACFILVYSHGQRYSISQSKPIECTATRMNLNTSDGLWVTMMCQCRFIRCSKCVSLVGMLRVGRLWSMRTRGYRKSLYLPLKKKKKRKKKLWNTCKLFVKITYPNGEML